MTHTRWRTVLATLGSLAMLQVAACDDEGGGGADGGTGGGPAVQLLTFTGPIAGTMTEARAVCEKLGTAPARLEVTLDGKVGGTDRRLKITIQNYAGAGNYGGSAVQVDIAGTTVSGDEASVAAGETSGTIESATNKDGNEVTGSWNCAGPPASK
jgi:hypothetical protein